MSIPSIAIFSIFAVVAVVALMMPEPDGVHANMTGFERNLWDFLGFFGIGQVPAGLALAVLMSTAAIAGATLDIIATMHLGAAYPSWFPANAAASGVGIGLLCARVLAASALPDSALVPGPPSQRSTARLQPQASMTPRERVWPASSSVPISLQSSDKPR